MRRRCAKRKVWVEPLFGEAKLWHGLRRFRLRRLPQVNMEALVIAVGQNLKRLLRPGWGRRPWPGCRQVGPHGQRVPQCPRGAPAIHHVEHEGAGAPTSIAHRTRFRGVVWNREWRSYSQFFQQPRRVSESGWWSGLPRHSGGRAKVPNALTR